jgi:hypothetical protein
MQSVYNFFYKWEVTRTSTAIVVIPRVKQCLTHKLYTDFFVKVFLLPRPQLRLGFQSLGLPQKDSLLLLMI